VTTPIIGQQPAADNAATPGLLPVAAPALPNGGIILSVGVGKQFATLGAAVAASHDGDTILVDAGNYVNDFATITTRITIIGVGGMASFSATLPPPNLKGIVTVDNDVTIENCSFSGCAIPDADGGNGAGLRYEGGKTILLNDAFSGNQNGLLGSAVIPQLSVNTISIDHCLFSGNGSGSGFTHNLYVGSVDGLTVTNSIFQGALVGHELKSRAFSNTIEGNLFIDGPTGTASYDIDLPDGGTDTIVGNTIEKGPLSQNNAMIHFGGEGIPYSGSSLTITGNSFINDKGPATVAVLNQTTTTIAISNNVFSQIPAAQIVSGPAMGSGNVDQSGNALPDISLVDGLPPGTVIFADAVPHSIVLTNTVTSVQGGAGLLTVSALAGHVTAIGGSGGMTLTEQPGSGGNLIVTQAASVNTITVSGQDRIDSEGADRIIAGPGNITGQVGGSAVIDDGSGNDAWTVNGIVSMTGHGGNPAITVGSQGSLKLTGALGILTLNNNGGSAAINITQGRLPVSLSVAGGSSTVAISAAQVSLATAAGTQGTTLRLGFGTVQVTSLGPDMIWVGSGMTTIIVSGAAQIRAGTGPLSVYGRNNVSGATLYGCGGSYLLSGDTGNITYYGGAKASVVQSVLSNDTLIGGTGKLTISGGSRERIVGGAGGITYSASDGGGANTISTMAGTVNRLTLAGANVITSGGQDTIYCGWGNQVISVYGNAILYGSTGNSRLSFFGRDSLIGQGQDTCSVMSGAVLAVQAGRLATINESGGVVNFSIAAGIFAMRATVSGGYAVISGGTNTAASIATSGGTTTQITLASGPATITSYGADIISSGSGTSVITLAAANTRITAGAGNVTIHNRDTKTGDPQTIRGATGTLSYDQGAGALSFVGGAGMATIDGGWGSLSIVGGAGNLAITNGSGGLRFVGGSGGATIALTPGGGDVTFGAGTTSVQVAGYGAADIFRFILGHGGGTDVISGFRAGTDRIAMQGVAVASTQTTGGSTDIVLTDLTHLRLLGVTDSSHVFG
jgi:hypothetical protein